MATTNWTDETASTAVNQWEAAAKKEIREAYSKQRAERRTLRTLNTKCVNNLREAVTADDIDRIKQCLDKLIKNSERLDEKDEVILN